MAAISSPSSSSVTNRPSFACIRCAERKVKCNRQRPCRACVNRNIDCIYQPPRPPQRKQKHVNDQSLLERLKCYEILLQEKGIDTNKLPETPQANQLGRSSQNLGAPKVFAPQTSSSLDSETSGNVSKTQVIQGEGRSMFVENSLWSRVVEEFHDPEDTLEGARDSSDAEPSEDDFSFVLGAQTNKNKAQHPPQETILQLWEAFVENVDPLTKLVHIPTLGPAIQKVASKVEAIPRSFEALLFAIYAAAVLSIDDDDCKRRFHEPRKTLLSRYINATKSVLSRAKFMETTTLVVLQALVLHLVSVRDLYEPRAVWSLTGVAVRIAQGMGLERDGTFLGLSPFETEMRRRLWWLLKTHDHRAAELCGLSKFRDLDLGPESTKQPLNVNDDQLYPNMTSFPVESKTLSDSIFISLRYELVSFAAGRVAKFRQEGKSPSQWDRDLASDGDKPNPDQALEDLESFIGMKYLRHCDPSQPLHLLTMLMARAAINTIRFLTHHPRRWASIQQTPSSERQMVWDVSINLLEQYSMLHSNSLLKRFAWHVAYVLQWHVFIHVLDTLRANPLKSEAEKAWRLVESTFEVYPALMADTRKLIHAAVGNLCLKAYNARTAALMQNNISLPPTSEFILKLRQRQEKARAKRQARDAKSIQAEHRNFNSVVSGPSTGTASSNNAPQPSPDPTQGGNVMTEADPFSYLNPLDGNRPQNLNNIMDIDLDFMIGQAHSAEDNTSYTISWEQWDTWLTDPDAALSFPLTSNFGAFE